MPDEETREERNCGTCVHRNLRHCLSAERGAEDEGGGITKAVSVIPSPHSCEHWDASDAHRQAEALEGIEALLLVMAREMLPGVVEVPRNEPFGCVCGAGLTAPVDVDAVTCPGCSQEWELRDGSWHEVDGPAEAYGPEDGGE
jgi:hypothetical protein